VPAIQSVADARAPSRKGIDGGWSGRGTAPAGACGRDDLCWTDSFVVTVAKGAITGIINVVQGRRPNVVVNFEATTHPRVRAWSSTV
jgi:hypothetical protein